MRLTSLTKRASGARAGVLRFAYSSAKFIWNAGKRALTAMVLLLLNATNLYEQRLRPELPADWLPFIDTAMAYIGAISPWIAAAIAIGAVLYTYYEVDREIRDPWVTKTLKSFYQDLEHLQNTAVANDEDVELLRDVINAKSEEVRAWVSEHMEPTALTRLTQRSRTGMHGFSFVRPGAFNQKHSELVDKIIAMQESLLALIERPVWV